MTQIAQLHDAGWLIAKCLEVEFSELPLYGVLGSLRSVYTTSTSILLNSWGIVIIAACPVGSSW